MSKTKTPNVIDLLIDNVGNAIVGYPQVKQLIAYSIIGGGHTLLESVPGLAKTLTMRAFCKSIKGARFARLQMTPSLLPPDITGDEVFVEGKFVFRKGPIFTNMFLADEINRATPKSQSALLEAMAERSVTTTQGVTHQMEDLFFVCATMNPVEQEGTYPLPEAQLDRFMFKIPMGYVSIEDRIRMNENKELSGRNPLAAVTDIVPMEEVLEVRRQANAVHTSRAAIEYAVNLVSATHPGEKMFDLVVDKANKFEQGNGEQFASAILIGGSPRAEQNLLTGARVRALHMGRDHVRPEDIQEVLQVVLAHRLVLDRKAKMKKVTGTKLVETVRNCVPFHEDLSAYAK